MHMRLFPLNTVLFPGAPLSLHVFEPRYKQMIAECLDEGEAFGVSLIREGDEAGDPSVMPHEIGTTAEIADARPLPEGRFFINTVGRRRFKIERIVSREPYLVADVTLLDEPDEAPTPEQHAAEEHVRKEFAEYMRLLVEFSGARSAVELEDDALAASYAIANALQVADAMKQHLLELSNDSGPTPRDGERILAQAAPAAALAARAQTSQGRAAPRGGRAGCDPLAAREALRKVFQPKLAAPPQGKRDAGLLDVHVRGSGDLPVGMPALGMDGDREPARERPATFFP